MVTTKCLPKNSNTANEHIYVCYTVTILSGNFVIVPIKKYVTNKPNTPCQWAASQSWNLRLDRHVCDRQFAPIYSLWNVGFLPQYFSYSRGKQYLGENQNDNGEIISNVCAVCEGYIVYL